MQEKYVKRFYSKVYQAKDCHLWQGYCDKQGYGRFFFNKKVWLAHRFSWFFHYENLTENQCVLHKCDNPQCVNINHLFLGSKKDNNLDRHNKGRDANTKGILNGNAKLSEQQVKEILFKYIPIKYSYAKLAKEYNVSKTQIIDIIKKRKWIDLH